MLVKLCEQIDNICLSTFLNLFLCSLRCTRLVGTSAELWDIHILVLFPEMYCLHCNSWSCGAAVVSVLLMRWAWIRIKCFDWDYFASCISSGAMSAFNKQHDRINYLNYCPVNPIFMSYISFILICGIDLVKWLRIWNSAMFNRILVICQLIKILKYYNLEVEESQF